MNRRYSKVFHGHRFVCERPGRWISECGHFGIYQMLAGLTAERWEVFYNPHGRDPIGGDMIGDGLTMDEAINDSFSIFVEDAP